jgi:hypothetical protein
MQRVQEVHAGLAHAMQASQGMWDRIRAEWQAFKYAPVGSRFVEHYERYQSRDAPYLKSMMFFATVFTLGMALLLTFVPGTALPFFVLALVLLPAESRTVATLYDRGEVFARQLRDRGRRGPRVSPDEPTQPVEYEPPEVPAEPVEPMSQRVDRPARASRPQVVGTLKIWSSDLPAPPPAEEPAPPPAAKNTIVFFPPPPGGGDSERTSR